MDAFISISLTACLIGIVIAIMDSLYPSQKYNNQIKMIFSLVFLSCIIIPVAENGFEIKDVFITSDNYNADIKTKYNDTTEYFKKSIENNISMELKSRLKNNDIIAEEIITYINIIDDNSICIREVEIYLADMENEYDAKRIVKDATDENVNIIIKECNND